MCYSEWLTDKVKKEHEQKYLAKNPFNFAVYENNTRHPYEQKPIKDNFEVEVIRNDSNQQPKPILVKSDEKHKADVVDSSNKENILPQVNQTGYKYSLTMVDFRRDFDKTYKLPTIRKPRLTSKQKIDQRNKKKKS